MKGEARRSGFTALQVNGVVSTNQRAVALWKSLGFLIIGTLPGASRYVDLGPTDLSVMLQEL